MSEKIEVRRGRTPGQYLDELIDLLGRQPHLLGAGLVADIWLTKARTVISPNTAKLIAATALQIDTDRR